MTREEWEAATLGPALAGTPDRHPDAATSSGRRVELVYTPDDLPRSGWAEADAASASQPTASPYAEQSSGALWAVEQSVGNGGVDAANATLRRLLAAGATAVEIDFDRPTRLGLDPDEAPDVRQVGHAGVSIATVDDVGRLFDGIDLRTVPVAMAIDGPAAVLLACVLVVAERRRIAWTDVRITLQNDVMGERLAGVESALPPRLAMRLVADVVAFCRQHALGVRPIVVTETPWRGVGATAGDQLAAMMVRATAYVAAAVAAGIPGAEAGRAVSFRFSAGSHFFEEIARVRAARRLWTSILTRRFGVTDEVACRVPICVEAGARSATTDERWDDVSRVAFQALAAVIGGVDIVQTATFERATDSEVSFTPVLAVRTQQVIAHESGLAGEQDPLGGAWFVERLTEDFCGQVTAALAAVDHHGGLEALIEQGRSLAEVLAASGPRPSPVPAGPGPDTAGSVTADRHEGVDWSQERVERLRAWRSARDSAEVTRSTGTIRRAVQTGERVMPALIQAARDGATVGEMWEALRSGVRA